MKGTIATLRRFGKLNSREVDPEIFGDALAKATQWSPLCRGGANFRTYRLVRVSDYRLEFQPTAAFRLFCAAFVLVGLTIGVGTTLSPGRGDGVQVAPFIGALFALIGVLMLFSAKPVVVDKMRGFVWRGRELPPRSFDAAGKLRLCEIGQAGALQIIDELVSGKTRFLSYELNLVLKDGNRQALIDHGDLDSIRNDAQTLSRFLGVPVWDATR